MENSSASMLQDLGTHHQKYLKELISNMRCGQLNISENDALVVVDMQNDFLPNGRFGVEEGDQIIPLIIELINVFLEKGGVIVATRDYHPIDHVSFKVFPPHCVQGHPGADICDPIAETLATAMKNKAYEDKIIIAFKGFHEDVDSFGAFQYDESRSEKRITQRHGEERVRPCSSCVLDWTGARILKSSSRIFDGEVNVNAPPDILSIHSSILLKDQLDNLNITRAFCCGLAMDFCVLDTSITGAVSGAFARGVNIILDATRASRVGGNFITPPSVFRKKTEDYYISLVPAVAITGGCRKSG
eukprot:TRINITY_DN1443_c0_g1_i1.p1 TRINITY_DN1443_c0_g1~~TRINITY_DN1443_c0_g1_i1.p1  ORF type:complete len:302 (+),score=52.78 TRINITY_DN1443_c0_g1_i1:63-968(+)